MQSSLVALRLMDKPGPKTDVSSSLNVHELKFTTISGFENLYHTDVRQSLRIFVRKFLRCMFETKFAYLCAFEVSRYKRDLVAKYLKLLYAHLE